MSDQAYLRRLAEALFELGSERALVVRGRDGMDELSTAAVNDVVEVSGDGVRAGTVDPAELGFVAPTDGEIAGGDPAHNAEVLRSVLSGAGRPRDLVLLNAAAGDLAGRRRPVAGGGPAAGGREHRQRRRARPARGLRRGDPAARGRRGGLMATFLESVVERTQADLKRRKRALPASELERRLGPARRGRPFSEALIDEGISLIAEMKRASPSRGPIRPGASVTEIVRAYQEAGARAVSVLTEPNHFGGSLDDLWRRARRATSPFSARTSWSTRYQLLEARAAGADAVLLIVAALEPDRLNALITGASDLGMDSLVEVHDEREIETAIDCGAEVLGINNRDLHTLEIDLGTTFRLLADVPAGTVVVAESGITRSQHVEELEEAGVDAILVGEALMRAEDPALAIRKLLG